jgi:glycolate oxidase iron-sulfur subunit
MRTEFPPGSAEGSDMSVSEAEVRKCVHCGFCLSTCPTYVLLGDERDSPRGRIYLIKTMLEEEAAPTPEVVRHIDRCLSCLSCETTCPSGVDYRRLIDHARIYTEEHYKRPLHERIVRRLVAALHPHPRRFRFALHLGRLARPFAGLFGQGSAIGAMLGLVPARMPARAGLQATPGGSRGRVALVQGCAEPVLRPEIRAATARLLARSGYEVVFVRGEGCCGALVHHIGRERDSLAAARRNVDLWTAEQERLGLDAIVTTAAGCGTMIKDYGALLRNDPDYAGKAERISAMARDVTELLSEGEVAAAPTGLSVTYHAACSLQHGQGVVEQPIRLLASAGFTVSEPAEAHLCCGSAGLYNILQPDLAARLKERKLGHIARANPDIVVAGNIGCAMQLASGAAVPVLHTAEMLDWATGGPLPAALAEAGIDRVLGILPRSNTPPQGEDHDPQ